MDMQLNKMFGYMTDLSHHLSMTLRWQEEERDCGCWKRLDDIFADPKIVRMQKEAPWLEEVLQWFCFLLQMGDEDVRCGHYRVMDIHIMRSLELMDERERAVAEHQHTRWETEVAEQSASDVHTRRRFECAAMLIDHEADDNSAVHSELSKAERYYVASSVDDIADLTAPVLIRPCQGAKSYGIVPERVFREVPLQADAYIPTLVHATWVRNFMAALAGGIGLIPGDHMEGRMLHFTPFQPGTMYYRSGSRDVCDLEITVDKKMVIAILKCFATLGRAIMLGFPAV